MAATTTHIFRVTLKPKLYRDIEIGSGRTLFDLAEAIVRAFDFHLDHAFGFYSKLGGGYTNSPTQYELFADVEPRTDVGSVKRTKVIQAFPGVGSKMLFLFDNNDEFRFKVEVIGLGEKVPKVRYPKVLKSVGKAPPQYPDMEHELAGEGE